MKRISCMYLDKKQVQEAVADLSVGNEYITETAGFVPLEVKLKQFEENGLRAQLSSADFTSADMREAYLSPDFEVTPEDDLEEINEKLAARQKFFNEIKVAKSDGETVEAGTEEPIKEPEKAKNKGEAE